MVMYGIMVHVDNVGSIRVTVIILGSKGSFIKHETITIDGAIMMIRVELFKRGLVIRSGSIIDDLVKTKMIRVRVETGIFGTRSMIFIFKDGITRLEDLTVEVGMRSNRECPNLRGSSSEML